nr:TIM barrel protein [Terriglobus sp. TAA 43]
MLNRRQVLKGMGAAASLLSMPSWALEVGGVQLGLQTYTFHNVRQGGLQAIDTILDGTRQLKVNQLELWAPQAEPFALPVRYWSPWSGAATEPATQVPQAERESRRNALRAWRTNTPPGHFADIRHRFDLAHIGLFSYNYSFEPTMTDAEIEHGFMAAKILRLKLITASSKVSMAKRVAPFAEKHGIMVAFHNHAVTKDPDDLATMDHFRQVLAMSSMYRINLDVAHYAASGLDAVAALEALHDKITNMHVHDRKANDGASVPFGEGVTPAAQILKMNRDRGWKIPCFYELEYVGADGRDVIAETRRELDYEIRVLNEK